jgi:hypothetical protein
MPNEEKTPCWMVIQKNNVPHFRLRPGWQEQRRANFGIQSRHCIVPIYNAKAIDIL